MLDGTDDFVAGRLDALQRLSREVAREPAAEVPELDVDAGYAAWAPSYDTMANAMIRAEEPVVAGLLAGIEPGAARDAACGTGRHTARLAAAGHRVLGVDRSPAMLSVARTKVPGARFGVGELTALPVADGAMDLAVCALALTHLRDPAPPILELARAVRPGGAVVLSDAHPTLVLVLGQAFFRHAGGLAFVRNHVHLHGRYLTAFAAGGFEVTGCHEVPMEPYVRQGLLAGAAEAATALFAGMPAVLVWALRRRG